MEEELMSSSTHGTIATVPNRRRRFLLQPPSLNDVTMPLSPLLFPEDLALEILLNLPVKSLLRFTCVSKSWNSLFFTSHFVNNHLHRSSSDSTLRYHRLLGRHTSGDGLQFSRSLLSLIHNPSPSPPLFDSLLFKELPCESLVVGSCNGLICCVYFGDYSSHYVCYFNPLTRLEYKSPRISHPWGGNHCITMFGFGYDNLTYRYKTFGIYCDPKVENIENKTLVQVYTLGDPNNSWRKMQSFPFVPMHATKRTSRFSEWCGKLVSDTLNWLCVRSDEKGSLVVVSVDIGKETCAEVLLPVVDKYEGIGSPKLWVLGGCLCFSYDFKGTQFVLWQMKQYGVTESWTMLLNISYQDVGFEHLYYYLPQPFIMLDTGEVLLQIKIDGLFILYNPRHKSFKYLEFQSEKIWFEGTTYIESLVSPCLTPC